HLRNSTPSSRPPSRSRHAPPVAKRNLPNPRLFQNLPSPLLPSNPESPQRALPRVPRRQRQNLSQRRRNAPPSPRPLSEPTSAAPPPTLRLDIPSPSQIIVNSCARSITQVRN